MCDISVFKIAKRDYESAVALYHCFKNDESQLNNVAYFLQQSVERTLKAFLECTGVTVPQTHDINKLVKMSHNNGSSVVITDWIEDKVDTLTRWEVDTRYNYDFCSSMNVVEAAIKEIKVFLEINGMKTEIREELKDQQVMKKLLGFLPKDTEYSDFELNCYYQVFLKKITT